VTEVREAFGRNEAVEQCTSRCTITRKGFARGGRKEGKSRRGGRRGLDDMEAKREAEKCRRKCRVHYDVMGAGMLTSRGAVGVRSDAVDTRQWRDPLIDMTMGMEDGKRGQQPAGGRHDVQRSVVS
jgi:hypothetical protein